MADFAYEPNYIHAPSIELPVEVDYSKNFNRRSYKTERNFTRKYELHFGYVNLTQRNLLRSHFEGQYGPYLAFDWTNPPDYVSDYGFEVNYDEEAEGMGYYEETPEVGGNVFHITLGFKSINSAAVFKQNLVVFQDTEDVIFQDTEDVIFQD